MTTSELKDELVLARRMSRLGTETAFEVLNKARALERQGRSIIHLEIGEPDFDTPANIVDAAVDALRAGWTHYGPFRWPARAAPNHCRYVSRTRGVAVSPDEVVVVPGGKPIIFFSMLALIDEGDEVIYPDPGFPIYESMINYAGGTAVPIPLREERNFSHGRGRTRRPHQRPHPTHHSQLATEPHRRHSAPRRYRAHRPGHRQPQHLVLSDEIYSRLQFEGEPFSIMSVPGMKERTILLDGFSKTYAMTGWRMGYGVMRADLAAQITRLMTNSNSCTASFTQMAGIEALRGDQSPVDTMRGEFERRSRAFVDGLNRIKGFHALMPKGAFYVFANVDQTGWEAKRLADALLEEAGVAALSGTAFGKNGEGFVRFSVANSMENLMEALARIDAWTKKRL